MSQGGPFAFSVALDWARTLVEDLAPVVARVKVAGSLRRRREWVRDIELVVEPKLITVPGLDLFSGPQQAPDIDSIRKVIGEWGTIAKGGDRYIQVMHVLGIRDLKVDVFLAHAPASWGSLLAIRTGPSALAKEAVTRMKRYGRYHVDGRVLVAATSEEFPTPTEEEFFAAAGLRMVAPHRRHLPEAFIGTENYMNQQEVNQ